MKLKTDCEKVGKMEGWNRMFRRLFFSFFLPASGFLLLAAGLSFAADIQTPDELKIGAEMTEEKSPQSGKASKRSYVRRGFRVLQERDADGDGAFESAYYYNKQGRLKRRESDTDGDGLADRWYNYLQGSYVILKEYDLNRDGKVDKRKIDSLEYDKNIKSMRHKTKYREEDADFDGIIDKFTDKNAKRGEGVSKKGAPIDPNPKVAIDD